MCVTCIMTVSENRTSLAILSKWTTSWQWQTLSYAFCVYDHVTLFSPAAAESSTSKSQYSTRPFFPSILASLLSPWSHDARSTHSTTELNHLQYRRYSCGSILWRISGRWHETRKPPKKHVRTRRIFKGDQCGVHRILNEWKGMVLL